MPSDLPKWDTKIKFYQEKVGKRSVSQPTGNWEIKQ